jgi:hypothetical protein
METKLTEQQSLEVITEMITRARNNVQKGSANSLIFNGYAAGLIAIANFILLHVLPVEHINMSYWIWCLMFPVGLIDCYIDRKQDRSALIKTEIDKIISSAWRGFVISVILLIAVIFSMAAIFRTGYYFTAITPVIMLMVAIAEFVMSKACRFKPFFWGAVAFWIGAVLFTLTFFVSKNSLGVHFLIFAACMVFGFIIPGHQLNKKAEEHV